MALTTINRSTPAGPTMAALCSQLAQVLHNLNYLHGLAANAGDEDVIPVFGITGFSQVQLSNLLSNAATALDDPAIDNLVKKII